MFVENDRISNIRQIYYFYIDATDVTIDSPASCRFFTITFEIYRSAQKWLVGSGKSTFIRNTGIVISIDIGHNFDFCTMIETTDFSTI